MDMEERTTLAPAEQSKVLHATKSKDHNANSSTTAKTSSQTTTEEIAQSLIELSTLPRLEKSPDGEHGNTEKINKDIDVDGQTRNDGRLESAIKQKEEKSKVENNDSAHQLDKTDVNPNNKKLVIGEGVSSSNEQVDIFKSLQEITNYMSSDVTLSPTLRGEISKLIPSLVKEFPQESHSDSSKEQSKQSGDEKSDGDVSISTATKSPKVLKQPRVCSPINLPSFNNVFTSSIIDSTTSSVSNTKTNFTTQPLNLKSPPQSPNIPVGAIELILQPATNRPISNKLFVNKEQRKETQIDVKNANITQGRNQHQQAHYNLPVILPKPSSEYTCYKIPTARQSTPSVFKRSIEEKMQEFVPIKPQPVTSEGKPKAKVVVKENVTKVDPEVVINNVLIDCFARNKHLKQADRKVGNVVTATQGSLVKLVPTIQQVVSPTPPLTPTQLLVPPLVQHQLDLDILQQANVFPLKTKTIREPNEQHFMNIAAHIESVDGFQDVNGKRYMKVKRTFFSLEEVSSAHQDFIRQAMADRPLSKTHQTVEDVSPKLVAKSTSDVGVQVSTLSAIKERQVTSNALKTSAVAKLANNLKNNREEKMKSTQEDKATSTEDLVELDQSMESESDNLIISLDDETMDVDENHSNSSSPTENADEETLHLDVTSITTDDVTSAKCATALKISSAQETAFSRGQKLTNNITANQVPPMRKNLSKSSENLDTNGKTSEKSNEIQLKNITFADGETENFFKSLTYDRNLKLNPILMTAENQQETKDFKEFDFAGTLAKARVSSKVAQQQGKEETCKKCQRKLYGSLAIKSHALTYSKFKCPRCLQQICDQTKLYKHIKSHLQFKFQCQKCLKAFDQYSAFKEHLKSVHMSDVSRMKALKKTTPWKCDSCKKQFKTFLAASKHKVKFCTKDWGEQSCCKVCSKMFRDATKLEAHKKLHRQEPIAEDTHKMKLNQKLAYRKLQIKKSVKLLHNKKHYCTRCVHGFKDCESFYAHINKRDCTYLKDDGVCMLCKKMFHSLNALQVHVKSCFKETLVGLLKPKKSCSSESESEREDNKRAVYHCTKCRRMFPSKFIYHKHCILYHFKPKTLQCNRCLFKCQSRSLLKKHLNNRKCPRLNAFQCYLCNPKDVKTPLKFKSLRTLLKHLNSHKKVEKMKPKQCKVLPVKLTLKDGREKLLTFSKEDAKRLVGKYHYVHHASQVFAVTVKMVNNDYEVVLANKQHTKKETALSPQLKVAMIPNPTKPPEESTFKVNINKNPKDTSAIIKSPTSSTIKPPTSSTVKSSTNSKLIATSPIKSPTRIPKPSMESLSQKAESQATVYFCDLCKTVYQTEDKLKTHYYEAKHFSRSRSIGRNRFDERRFTWECYICNKRINDPFNHATKHAEWMLECYRCTVKVTTIESLVKHFERKHSERGYTEDDRAFYDHFQGQMVWQKVQIMFMFRMSKPNQTDIDDLDANSRMLTQSVHKCEGCNTSFMHKKTLQRHQEKTCMPSQSMMPSPAQEMPSPRPKQSVDVSDTDKVPPPKAKKVKKIAHRRKSNNVDESPTKNAANKSQESNPSEPDCSPKKKGQLNPNLTPSNTSSKSVPKNKSNGKTASKSTSKSTAITQAVGSEKPTQIPIKEMNSPESVISPSRKKTGGRNKDVLYQYFKCSLCHSVFTLYQEVIDHFSERHSLVKQYLEPGIMCAKQNQLHTCVNCGLVYSCSHAMLICRLSHIGIEVETCSVCLDTLPTKTSLQYHMLGKHKSLFCHICYKGFHSYQDLLNHCQLHVHEILIPRDENGKMMIEIGTTNNPKTFLFDKQTEEESEKFLCTSLIPPNVIADNRLFYCAICQQNIEGELTHIVHMKTHQSKRPLSCLVCHQRFDSVDELNEHHKTNSHKKQRNTFDDRVLRLPTGHICFLCFLVFEDSTSLRQHQSDHAKPISDEELKKSLSIMNSVNSYVMRSSEPHDKNNNAVDWPEDLKCVEKFCGIERLVARDLLSNMHAGKGPDLQHNWNCCTKKAKVFCPICSSNVDELSEHYQTVHLDSGKPSSIFCCQKEFKTYVEVVSHTKQRHGKMLKSGRSLFMCPHCFVPETYVHIMGHHEGISFTSQTIRCSYCNLLFHQNNFREHLRSKNPRQACVDCSRSSALTNSLVSDPSVNISESSNKKLVEISNTSDIPATSYKLKEKENSTNIPGSSKFVLAGSPRKSRKVKKIRQDIKPDVSNAKTTKAKMETKRSARDVVSKYKKLNNKSITPTINKNKDNPSPQKKKAIKTIMAEMREGKKKRAEAQKVDKQAIATSQPMVQDLPAPTFTSRRKSATKAENKIKALDQVEKRSPSTTKTKVKDLPKKTVEVAKRKESPKIKAIEEAKEKKRQKHVSVFNKQSKTAAVEKSVPIKPVKPSPSKPVKSTPSKPVKSSPSKPVKSTPSKPVKSTPVKDTLIKAKRKSNFGGEDKENKTTKVKNDDKQQSKSPKKIASQDEDKSEEDTSAEPNAPKDETTVCKEREIQQLDATYQKILELADGTCKLCTWNFQTYDELKDHLLRHQIVKDDISGDVTKATCHLCGKMSVINQMNKHIVLQHNKEVNAHRKKRKTEDDTNKRLSFSQAVNSLYDSKFMCCLCNQSQQTLDGYLKHFETSHLALLDLELEKFNVNSNTQVIQDLHQYKEKKNPGSQAKTPKDTATPKQTPQRRKSTWVMGIPAPTTFPYPHSCIVCGKGFYTRGQCSLHLKNIHPWFDESNTELVAKFTSQHTTPATVTVERLPSPLLQGKMPSETSTIDENASTERAAKRKKATSSDKKTNLLHSQNVELRIENLLAAKKKSPPKNSSGNTRKIIRPGKPPSAFKKRKSRLNVAKDDRDEMDANVSTSDVEEEPVKDDVQMEIVGVEGNESDVSSSSSASEIEEETEEEIIESSSDEEGEGKVACKRKDLKKTTKADDVDEGFQQEKKHDQKMDIPTDEVTHEKKDEEVNQDARVVEQIDDAVNTSSSETKKTDVVEDEDSTQEKGEEKNAEEKKDEEKKDEETHLTNDENPQRETGQAKLDTESSTSLDSNLTTLESEKVGESNQLTGVNGEKQENEQSTNGQAIASSFDVTDKPVQESTKPAKSPITLKPKPSKDEENVTKFISREVSTVHDDSIAEDSKIFKRDPDPLGLSIKPKEDALVININQQLPLLSPKDLEHEKFFEGSTTPTGGIIIEQENDPNISKTPLQSHSNGGHFATNYPLVCLFCGQGYYTRFSLKSHLIVKHANCYTTDLEKTNSFVNLDYPDVHATISGDTQVEEVPKPRRSRAKFEEVMRSLKPVSRPTNKAASSQHKSQTSSSTSKAGQKRKMSVSVSPKTKKKKPALKEPVDEESEEIEEKSSDAETQSSDDDEDEKEEEKVQKKKGKLTKKVKYADKCEWCDQLLRNKSELEKHVERHFKGSKLNLLTCDSCFCLIERHLLKRHMHMEHDDVPLSKKRLWCKHCNYSTRSHTPKNLDKHIYEKHPFMLKIECRICDARFPTTAAYNEHFADTHGKSLDEQSMECLFCNKKFQTLNKLYCHFSIIHMKKNKDLYCELCCKYFYGRTDLDNHQEEFHKNDNYQCGLCLVDFTSAEVCEKHVMVHKTVTENQCDICKFYFDSEETLTKHKVTHVDENSVPVQNSEAGGQVTSNEDALAEGSITEGNRTNEETDVEMNSLPFDNTCTNCNETFLRREIFEEHVKKCGKKTHDES
ncbi:uncharacterized protein [Clytia hemisphaerica]|uniref:uncharacterized protein n=1 Tax=Clytia hemisphaerica TaxID=252671 RepID=UPI0034D45796